MGGGASKPELKDSGVEQNNQKYVVLGPSTHVTGSKDETNHWLPVGITIGVIILLAAIGLIIYVLTRRLSRRNRRHARAYRSSTNLAGPAGPAVHFTHSPARDDILKVATILGRQRPPAYESDSELPRRAPPSSPVNFDSV